MACTYSAPVRLQSFPKTHRLLYISILYFSLTVIAMPVCNNAKPLYLPFNLSCLLFFCILCTHTLFLLVVSLPQCFHLAALCFTCDLRRRRRGYTLPRRCQECWNVNGSKKNQRRGGCQSNLTATLNFSKRKLKPPSDLLKLTSKLKKELKEGTQQARSEPKQATSSLVSFTSNFRV